mmetsp:Transcript_108231/g.170630  ORF Transcript_108231/g.170630 Transcript_108231/m.170630 type:complete len:600 (+) Transcript_108231:40-1839(+)
MAALFDFDHLEGLEVAAHLRDFVLGRLPIKAVSWQQECEDQTTDSFGDCPDDEANFGVEFEEDYKIELTNRSFKGKRMQRRSRRLENDKKPYCAKISKFPQKVIRNPNACGRWSSLAASALRKDHGDCRRGSRAIQQQDRKERLARMGLEEPAVMPRYERWLRSPFVEHHDCARLCKVVSSRTGHRKLCEENDDKPANLVVLTKLGGSSKNSKDCVRCGCSKEFDEYGDRFCWCDSCYNGCQRVISGNTLKAESASQQRLNLWARLVAGILHSRDADLSAPCVSRKQLRARVLKPSTGVAQRWAHLHDDRTMTMLASQQRASLFHVLPPHELTLSFQQKQLKAIEEKRRSNQIYRRWNRISSGMSASYRRQCRRNAAQEFLHSGMCQNEECLRDWATSAKPVTSSTTTDETLAAQLGLDVETYRMLRQLEQRDIRPEDYELLGRLDDAVKPKTLNIADLERFTTKKYLAVSTCNVSTFSHRFPQFGVAFWQLPLPFLEDEPKEIVANSTCFGLDFWKIEYPKVEDSGLASTVASDNGNEDLENDCLLAVCGVCLLDFDDGDELRVLSCRHYFHRDCIDHWLLHSATTCPTCKQELGQEN